jgi:transposase
MIAPVETGKVSVSLQRLRYLERDSEECGELKRQLSEVKRERDSLKQQLSEADNIIRNLVAELYVRTYLKRGERDTTQTATTTPVRGGEDS